MFGGVDILVNNAAHCEAPDDILTTTAGSIDRHFEVNTRAAVLMIAEYVRRHRSRNGRWGRVVNISTDCAQAFGGQISYGASKAAMEAYTQHRPGGGAWDHRERRCARTGRCGTAFG